MASVKCWVLAVTVVVVFQYDGPGQSVARIIAIAVGAVLAQKWIQEVLDFAPFRVHVRILSDLLVDFELADDARFKALSEDRPSDYSPLRNGITFTLLRVSAFAEPHALVYWPDFRAFTTKVETMIEIEELQTPAAPSDPLGRTEDSPYLELDHTPHGLVFNIVEPHRSESPRRIALLPWSEFHVRQWRYGSTSDKKRDALVSEHGWARGDRSPDFHEAPFELRHKYLWVTYNYI